MCNGAGCLIRERKTQLFSWLGFWPGRSNAAPRNLTLNSLIPGNSATPWPIVNRRCRMKKCTALIDCIAGAKVRQEQVEAFQALATENQAQSEAFLESNKTKTGIVVMPGGVQYRIIEEGEGCQAEHGKHRQGSLSRFQDGRSVNSTVLSRRGVPEEFTVNSVLAGLAGSSAPDEAGCDLANLCAAGTGIWAAR